IGSSDGSGGVDTGTLYLRLLPKAKRNVTQQQLEQQIRHEARRIGGVTAYLSQAGGPGGNTKQIQLQVRGQDEDKLEASARQIMAAIAKVPGAADIGLSTRGQRPELEIELHRGLAGTLGLTAGQIAQSLRPAFAGLKAGDWV